MELPPNPSNDLSKSNRRSLSATAILLLLSMALAPTTAAKALASGPPSNLPRPAIPKFSPPGRHVRSFVVRTKGARAFVSTTAPSGPRPVQRFDTGQALAVNPTAVFFTPQPGAANPSAQPYTYGSDYSLSSSGAASSANRGFGGGAITSGDFSGNGRQETVSAERCNGADICLLLRRSDGTYSSWWDSGLLLDTADFNSADRFVLTTADFTGTGQPEVAMAYEANDYVVNLATFSVDANPSQSQPFAQTAITTVGQLLVNTATGNIRQSFAITKGDFAGNGLQEVAVGFDSPLPVFPTFSQAQISIYGMQSGQLTAEGGAVVPTNPYYLSLAAGRVLRGPAATQGDDLVVATGYPTSQQVNVFSLTLSNGSFSANQGYNYQTNSTGQFKSDLTDANIQVATGDLQANGGADIVVAQTGDENPGPNEDFAPVEVITLGSSPSDSSLYQTELALHFAAAPALTSAASSPSRSATCNL